MSFANPTRVDASQDACDTDRVRCLFLMPVRADDFHTRALAMQRAYRCLSAAIAEVTPSLSDCVLVLAINDPRSALPGTSDVLRVLSPFRSLHVEIVWSMELGKVPAVNMGLEMARSCRADLFFCVDNDIVFDRDAVDRLVQQYGRARHSGLVCKKAPLLTVSSTDFQRIYSVSFRLSFAFDIFPKRPTGSLYCVDPTAICAFPAGCNEGDYLAQCGVPFSDVTIYSEFPQTFEDEVARRTRLADGARSIDHRRPTDDLDLMYWILRTTTAPPDVVTSQSFLDSISLYERVLSSAAMPS